VSSAVSLIAAAALLTVAVAAQTPIPPSYGQPPVPKVVAYVELALQQGDLASAEAMVGQYRKLYGDTPEALDALSWLARGELGGGHIEQAIQDAKEVESKSKAALATRTMDQEPYLPIAMGAAYEVQAEALAAQHQRSQALLILQNAMRQWHGTSLTERLQKTINELTLVGKPAPPIRAPEWIGKKPEPQTAWRGKVVLLFFWAHWCSDCKADVPAISNIAAEFEPKGLVLVAPTRLYGYTAQEEHAAATVEKPFIEKVYDRYYSHIPDAQVPIDAGNFQRYGASTTPTIVLIDRQGIVRFYHPGEMTQAELATTIAPLIGHAPSHRD
jgi:thiol-disulfide isomerase/thioredoxin